MRILMPSLLGASFKYMEQEIRVMGKVGTQYIHSGVMDGAFILSISFGMSATVSLGSCTEWVFDVHMTVEKSERYTDDIRACGTDIICVHAEACIRLDSAISRTKVSGARAGVALNPAMPIHVLEQILSQADAVLTMAVNPSFGGQSSIPYALEKVRAPRTWCDSLGLIMGVEVDGGIPAVSMRPVLEVGVNAIVAGSTVFKGDAYENIRELMELSREYER